MCDAAELPQAFHGDGEPVALLELQVADAGDHGGGFRHRRYHAERLDGVGCRGHVDCDPGKGALVFDHDPVVGVRDLAAHLLECIKEEPVSLHGFRVQAGHRHPAAADRGKRKEVRGRRVVPFDDVRVAGVMILVADVELLVSSAPDHGAKIGHDTGGDVEIGLRRGCTRDRERDLVMCIGAAIRTEEANWLLTDPSIVALPPRRRPPIVSGG